MQIEAIRAHPGSAHVMVYGTRRNPSCCMRGITTAPRACSSPAMARDTGGLETGAPELGQFPHHHPQVSQSSQRRIFQRKSLLLFQGYTNPATSKPHWLLGYERRRDGGGRHHWEQLQSLFPHQAIKSAPSRASLRFGTRVQADALC